MLRRVIVKIQEWIKVIPYHIKEVIRLKGGNEYKEGAKKGAREGNNIYIKYIFNYYKFDEVIYPLALTN